MRRVWPLAGVQFLGAGAISLLAAEVRAADLVFFFIPFLLFSAVAGRIIDARPKRNVLLVSAGLGLAAVSLGWLALRTSRIDMLLGALMLGGVQAAFFLPALHARVAEIVSESQLSRATAMIQCGLFLGILAGSRLSGRGGIGLLLAVSAVLLAMQVPKSPAGALEAAGTTIFRERSVRLTLLGLAYFWFVATLFVVWYDERAMGVPAEYLVIGVAAGCLAAGRLSGERVELGLPPLGAVWVGVCGLLLARYRTTAVWLALLGFSAGLFLVPLLAFLIHRSRPQERVRVLAVSFLLNTAGILAGAGVLRFEFAQDRAMTVFGLLTLAGAAYVLTVLPDFLIRFVLWMLTHSVYRIRLAGQENIPRCGPALLVSNHISLVDPLLIGACTPRFIRFLMYKPYYEIRGLNRLFRLMKAIPIQGGDSKLVEESIARARQELRDGHVVCIFAEGSVSRTGNLLKFKRGFERIVEGLDTPIIPVHLDRLWGSIFSFKDGRFFWKWPERIPYPVTVSFGPAMSSSATAFDVRLAVQELGAEAVRQRRTPRDLLPLRFLRTARRRWFSFCMGDATGRRLTWGGVAAECVLLARRIRQRCARGEMVGLLLRPAVDAALANIAVSLAGNVPVNLNFTAGDAAVDATCAQYGIRTVILSRTLPSGASLKARRGAVYLEDLLGSASPVQRAAAAVAAALRPAWTYSRNRLTPDSLATVIPPKGVMLSHHNILANIEGLAQVFWVTRRDRLMGILPFYDPLGFTVNLWLPLVTGLGVVYHPNSIDARSAGELVQQQGVTILVGTPDFCKACLKEVSPEKFSTLRYALAGIGSVEQTLAGEFAEKFGFPLLEGYGIAEMSPVVSVNIPDYDYGRRTQIGVKPGTAGQPIPGVAVKVVDPETHRSLGPEQEGLFLLKGPNRMLGYFGQPEKTARAFAGGWLVSGDFGSIDDDGFLRVTR